MLSLQQLSFFHQEGTKSPWPVWGQVTGGVGGCSAGSGPCWRGPALVEVTGARSCSPGAPDTTQHLPPRGAASAHLSAGSLNGKAGRVRSSPLPSSPTVTWFCYSTNPHVKDRQRHEILIRPGASHIASCCKGVSAGELSIDSLRRYTGTEDLDLYRSAFDLLQKAKNPLIVSLTVLLLCVLSIIQMLHTHTHKIRYLPLFLAHFLIPLLLSAPFSPSFSSSSQVGIHHHAGGHLSSDSFVNVNYCSLSGVVSARESGTCRAAHCMLRRTQNNQPIGALCLDPPHSVVSPLSFCESLSPLTLPLSSLASPEHATPLTYIEIF